MASPACPTLPTLRRVAPGRPPPKHPLHPSLLPFPSPPAAHPDPLPCTSFPHSLLVSPPANAPFFRSVFQDAVCDSSPAGAAVLTTSVHACSDASTKQGRLESAEDSTNSSFSSSSDFCMSSNSDNDEDDTGSSSTSLNSSLESPLAQEGPLDSLASLCAALPIKRGLSRYFSGKSQSFSSLARVSSVAELAKPETPYVKRRRTAGIGTGSTLKHHSYPPRCSSSASVSKRLATSNRFKSFKPIPCPEGVSLEGLAKCFSVPEF